MNEILAAASPLSERLAGRFISDDGLHEDALRKERWNKWAAILSRDDPNLLLERLRLAGVRREQALSLLGRVRLADGIESPSWERILLAALDEPESLASADDASLAHLRKKFAWAAFYEPFLRPARAELHSRAGALTSLLAPPAMQALESALLARMNAAAQRTLELEFSLSQALSPAGPSFNSRGDEREKLARCWHREGVIFRDYPALARLLSLCVEFWIEAVSEFLERLRADLPSICDAFFAGKEPDRIEALSASLSDPHRRGRSVFIITFTNGEKLVYKPRSLGLEAAFFQVAEWINARAGATVPDFHVVRTLDRSDYGWMEFVTHELCGSEDAVARYFERAGALLALLYVLAGADMHQENLIAHGEYPVPVDLEVLMIPQRDVPELLEPGTAAETAVSRLGRSVLSVGLLPSWFPLKKGVAANIAGLAPNQIFGSEEPSQATHLPHVNGTAASSRAHRKQILEGFEQTYSFLLEHRDGLLGESGPLRAFSALPVRVVNRNTALYGKILRKSTTPSALESGVARSVELEILAKSSLFSPECHRDCVNAVCEAEIAALEQGDIPFFQTRLDGRHLDLPETGRRLEGFFSKSGLEVSQDRLKGLSLDDLAQQKQFIALSFDFTEKREPVFSAPHAPSLTEFEPVAAACAIARMLGNDAIVSAEDMAWIGPALIPETDAFVLTSVSPSLYDGKVGVMLFLFAIARCCKEEESRALAWRLFDSLQRSFRSPLSKKLAQQTTPRGLSGLGGHIYSLVTAGRLANDSRPIDAAVEFAGLFSENFLSRDESYDILAGCAGAIAGYLALHAVDAGGPWLKRAIFCGDHLLASRKETASGLRSWRSGGKFLSGYSHGAAGIAASLLRLHGACGQERFLHAAREAIDYENTLFDSAEKNWLDLRERKAGRFMMTWCHGAPGIALARMQGLASLDTAVIRANIAEALETTARVDLIDADHCCCGAAGRANILLTAAAKLGRSDCLLAAHELMRARVSSAEALGGYACYSLLPRSVRGPGFFQGLSGIGYTLLRLKHPELPDVLALESNLSGRLSLPPDAFVST